MLFASSYIHYSNIAAQALRGSLKETLRSDAAKRADSHVRFVKWTEGKPARKYILPPSTNILPIYPSQMKTKSKEPIFVAEMCLV